MKPVRDVHFIAEATGKTVAQVREKFAELGIAPSASSNDSVSDNINLGRKSRKPRERANTEEAPPLTHWDTLAP
ncbi:hypothetical protein H6768_00310 [Candidatus Peribacteria bacterium]|nr:hypothetical protein [Candidatus Peribacteria bacterium]